MTAGRAVAAAHAQASGSLLLVEDDKELEAIVTTLKQERAALIAGKPLHLTEHDEMIAARIFGALEALEAAQRSGQQRGAADPGCPGYIIELVAARAAEVLRQRDLIVGENVDSKMRRGLERFGLADLVQLDVEITDDVTPDGQSGKLKRITSRVGPPEEAEAKPRAAERLAAG